MNPRATPPIYDSSRSRGLADVWRTRELLYRMTERNLKVKYQRSVLGFVWTLFNPLLTVAILMTVFSVIVRLGIPDYWAFLLSGYFVFNFSLQMLNTAVTVLRDHAQLTKSAAFPSEVLIFGATLARLVEFGVAMVPVLLALVLFHHGTVPASFILLPLLVLVQVLLVIGVVMPLAVLSVFFYDVEHAIPVIVMMLFYISPVFYPVSFVPAAVRDLYLLNPLAGLLTLYQTVLYDGRFPSFGLLAGTAVAGLAAAFIGYVIFNRYRATCAEVV